MSLSRLDIHQVRNIATARLALNKRFNVFFGSNGSGKTSLLESIYLLGSGHSFRTRETLALITHEMPELTVFGEMAEGGSVSIRKDKRKTAVYLNQKACRRSSDLARHLPCQVFYQDIFDIMDAGPAVRRSLLDWGLFHQAPDYHTVWKDYKRALKQRNMLLRDRAPRRAFEPWDAQLVDLSGVLDEFRMDYFKQWALIFDDLLPRLTTYRCCIAYDKGWDRAQKGLSLEEVLDAQFEMDIARQYTHSGAHQADILFETVGKKAKQTLSRGQQKMVLIALKLAQASLLPSDCVYLFDDITTELDDLHVSRFFEVLQAIEGQFFFTSIDSKLFKEKLLKQHTHFFELSAGQVLAESL